MQTKLATPVELQLIVQVTLSLIVVNLTALGSPLVTHGVVEAVITLVRLLILCNTCLWVDPLQLRVIIQVGDTATILTEHVIPSNQTTERQTFRDEVEFLLQNEVGIDTGRGNGLYTTDRRCLCGVADIGRTRQETPRAITILWQEGIRRDIVNTSPHLRHLPTQ